MSSLAQNQYGGQTFGAWPPQSPVYPYTLQHLYVDPVNGQDFNNPSGSQARPLRSMTEVARRLVGFQGATDVHMRSGDYVLPSSGVFLQSRMLNGLVRFIADDVWDPTVFEVLLDTTAQAGSTSSDIVVTGPLTPDEFAGLTVEVTDGLVVQRKTIRDTTTTDITPCGGFNLFNVGDRVRVLKTRARFTLPVLTPLPAAVQWTNYVFAQDSPSYRAGIFDAPFAKIESAVNPAGVVLRGVAFVLPNSGAGLSNFGEYYFGKLPVFFYGVELRNPAILSFNGTCAYAGYGLTAETLQLGWGIGVFTDDAPANATAFIEGYETRFIGTIVNATGNFLGYDAAADVQLYSGRCLTTGILEDVGWLRCDVSQDAGGVPTLFDATGSGQTAINLGGVDTRASLNGVDIRGGNGGLFVQLGANVFLGVNCIGTTDSGNVVEVVHGARLYVFRGTNVGGAGTDWVVQGQLPFNKSVFAVQGVGVLGTDSASLAVSV